MINAGSLVPTGRIPVLMLVLAAAMLSGCESKQEKALDQAKAAGGCNRATAAGGYCRQERDHDDHRGAAAGKGADDRGDCHHHHTARRGCAHSSALGTDGFRGPATGQRQHPGGNDADHPDRSAHQRKRQPRG